MLSKLSHKTLTQLVIYYNLNLEGAILRDVRARLKSISHSDALESMLLPVRFAMSAKFTKGHDTLLASCLVDEHRAKLITSHKLAANVNQLINRICEKSFRLLYHDMTLWGKIHFLFEMFFLRRHLRKLYSDNPFFRFEYFAPIPSRYPLMVKSAILKTAVHPVVGIIHDATDRAKLSIRRWIATYAYADRFDFVS